MTDQQHLMSPSRVTWPSTAAPLNEVARFMGEAVDNIDYDPLRMEYRVTTVSGNTGLITQNQMMQMSSAAASFLNTTSSSSSMHLTRNWFENPPASQPTPKEESLLAKILRWYTASMAGDIRSPLLHLVGPPGCGKSTSVEQAAEILGVNLHIINVSRMNPLEIEGVQMPIDQNTRLLMLTASWWQELKDGDIVLLDEFLRGFAEVYNGLLDVLTSRRVGAFRLPKVFFIAASNSIATYDKALEDRLLHQPVEDPRTHKAEHQHIAKTIVDALGLVPDMAKSPSMDNLLSQEVYPMYVLLDQLAGIANATSSRITGHSPRNLIGQVRLRQVESTSLRSLIEANNQQAMRSQLHQHVILLDGKDPDPTYVQRARKLVGNPKLSEIQAQNLELNLQLIEMQEALSEIDDDIKEVDFDDPLS